MKRSVRVLFLLFAAVTAFGSSGLVSPFAPEAAYTAYGGAIERLEQRLPDFYGGSGQSAAYQVTYGTLSAATVFIGTEFGQAGRVAQVGRTASRPQLLLPAGRQPVALLPEAAESLAAKTGPRWTAQDFVQEVATRAERKIGGTGAVAGTQKHAYAAELIERYQRRFGPVGGGLATEQSYLGGAYLGRSVNLPGSVRLDVVEGTLTSPSAVFEFKFTINPNPVLSPGRIGSIRANAGLGPSVPITVVHP